MSKRGSTESRLSRYLKVPIRFLMKAGDFYVKSMTEYSERVGYGTVMGCPTGQVHALPRSYSVGSTRSGHGDDDYRELMRAASARKFDNNKARRQSPIMPRSQSVGIGRIDEDEPCEFEDDIIKVKPAYFPRSRSYAVTNRKGGL
ncbi:ARM repeat superfamily protein isoform 1 [Hibiscus syriacus]|uniref:ARM repeat superfamily protein isoform 1 n=1 Tax=Hibiscus syriacus TaxID=106335 RepID=A0A6A2XJA5_HIBSY|nr:uncharacterized protein LOC120166922 [Hibiscus syriacus]KAE8675632.1 ARM repeat superfamily protein isoform 1 [Hibiscus syriacus]